MACPVLSFQSLPSTSDAIPSAWALRRLTRSRNCTTLWLRSAPWRRSSSARASSTKGYNLFVLGEEGTGRRTLVKRYLLERARDEEPASDWCYVNNFAESRRPRAVELPAGQRTRARSRYGSAHRRRAHCDPGRVRERGLSDASRSHRKRASGRTRGCVRRGHETRKGTGNRRHSDAYRHCVRPHSRWRNHRTRRVQ